VGTSITKDMGLGLHSTRISHAGLAKLAIFDLVMSEIEIKVYLH